MKSYRDYLRLVLEDRKKQLRGVSIGFLAKKFGMSESLLKMVLQGKRDLQMPHLHKVAQALGFDAAEHQYFEALVLFEQSTAPEEKAYYRKRLSSLRSLDSVKSKKSSSRKQVLSRHLLQSWQTPAVLIYLLDFVQVAEKGLSSLDLPQMSKLFGMTETDLQRFVQQCYDNGLMTTTSDDNIHLSFERLGQVVHRKNYFSSLFQEIKKRMENEWGKPNTGFEAHVFTLDESQISSLLQDYKELIEKYMALKNTTEKRRVLQVCLQMFPVV